MGPLSPGCAPMNVEGRRMLVVDEAPEVYPGTVAYEDHAGHMLERGGCLRAPPLPCAGRRIQRSCMLRKLKNLSSTFMRRCPRPDFHRFQVHFACPKGPQALPGQPGGALGAPGPSPGSPGMLRQFPPERPGSSRGFPGDRLDMILGSNFGACWTPGRGIIDFLKIIVSL